MGTVCSIEGALKEPGPEVLQCRCSGGVAGSMVVDQRNRAVFLQWRNEAGIPVVLPRLVRAVRKVRQVACGAEHYLVLTEAAVVYSGGLNSWGQLGIVDAETRANSDLNPERVDLSDVWCISAAENSSMAVNNRGQAFAWGFDSGLGNLGLGGKPRQPSAVLVPTELRALRGIRLVAIACGASVGFGISHLGMAYSWGECRHGLLGTGVKSHEFLPQKLSVFEGSCRVRSISVGSRHALAVDVKGAIWQWGQVLNELQYKGAEPRVNAIPVRTAGGGHPLFVEVAAGCDHALGLTNFGHVWGIGSNHQNQLGASPPVMLRDWTPLAGFDSVVEIATGHYHSVVMGRDHFPRFCGDGRASRFGGLPLTRLDLTLLSEPT
mmetsp:Transcript_56301/g.123302  ORF Transcript_56301/g.123302 Transcript_56301/m.123302 type:complete len:378 (+) Transcript_56301:30-1163(+)|eukprot:CAMPEP_0204320292 /NCGR_PEP_ID=MMETSP0469-20131031/7570_1 /ASSEMBLY_ACC=CAM_ASM_000384 /TAXON_ID=2969 /ORGANISM="Oxyrrhis marina" /LENGTH=377 /DNA_ID=CAMNT_0051301555 /DNA_START=16 /DNA_END=1149 /DNA_ORIENTATION=-